MRLPSLDSYKRQAAEVQIIQLPRLQIHPGRQNVQHLILRPSHRPRHPQHLLPLAHCFASLLTVASINFVLAGCPWTFFIAASHSVSIETVTSPETSV
jgi:hypothetical protein